MSGEASLPSREKLPRECSLGLEQLDPREVERLGRFIDIYAPWLVGQFEGEVEALRSAAAFELQVIDVEVMSRDDNPEVRNIACSHIAQFAERNPEIGFPIWAQFMNDPDGNVATCARDVLATSLGVLDLDSRGVVSVIKAMIHRED